MTGSKSKESAGERKYISDNMEKEGCRRTVLVGALCAIVFPFLYANKSVLSDGCIVGNPLIYLIITEALIVTAIATSYLALLSKDTGILSRKVCLVALACSVFADALLFRNIYFQQMVFIILSAAVSWAMLWSVKMTLIWMITLAAVACANLSISGWSIELVICMFAAVGFSSVISELSYMSVREKMKNVRISMIMPVGFGLLVGTFFVGLYLLLFSLPTERTFESRWFIPVMMLLLGHSLTTTLRGMKTYLSALKTDEEQYEFQRGNGASHLKAVMPFVRRAFMAVMSPTIANIQSTALYTMPLLLCGILMAGVQPINAFVVMMMLVIGCVTASVVSLMTALWIADGKLFDSFGKLR